MRFDPMDFTLKELADFERKVGRTWSQVMAERQVIGPDGKPVRDKRGRPVQQVDFSMEEYTGLMWLIRRRDDPGYTWEQAENLTLRDMERLEFVVDDSPLVGNGQRSSRPSPKSATTTN
jgi:hypothetical protein